MIARGFLSLHRAALSAPLKNSTNSNYSRTGHPTKDVHPEPAEGLFSDSSVLLTNSPNSNYSHTYATPGGRGCTGLLVRPLPQLLCFPCLRKKGRCTPAKMSARRHLLSLFSQSPLSTLLRFNYLRTLSFSVSHVSFIPPTPSALLHQKPGGTPHSGHTNASDGPCLSLRNLFPAFRLSVLCVSAVS